MSSFRKSVPSSNTIPLLASNPGTVIMAQEHTPPPHYYTNIKPCSHILSVLDSKAKETVYSTYKQAAEISSSTLPNRIYTLRKDGSVVPQSKLTELKTTSIKCTTCALNNFHHNFMCLQCPHVGCFNENNHAYAHYKGNQHLFGIDSSNGLLYCFSCGDYINHPDLEKIRLEAFIGSAQNQVESIDDDIDSHYTNPSSGAISGLKGFVNLGSTCFMSCILQTFIHNPIIKHQFFNNDFHFFNCESNFEYFNGGTIDETNACITCSIDDIFKNFFTSSSNDGFGMTNLLLTAWFKKKSLAGFQEQDAHEFWQFLLNELHSDYEKIITSLGEEVPEKCQCITHSTFSGKLESSIKCLSCNSATNTVDPMIDLSLEIVQMSKNSKAVDLYDCLDVFTKEEKLEALYKCQNCSEKAEATKSLKFKELPPVLSIQLKRFEHNIYNETSSKLEAPVSIPLYLNLTKYVSDSDYNTDQIDGDKIFELFALVCHIGSVNTGHYIVIMKNGSGKWFRFDDSVISLISQEEVSKTNAYLLFYISHRI